MRIDHLAEIFFMSSTVLFITNIGFAIGWARARARAARAEGFAEGVRAMPASQQHINPAIDAIAMEVERIGEGQRFLTRVLAPQHKSGQSITPH